MQAPPIQVVIPSYRRSDTIKGKTLLVLQAQGVPPERVWICVADDTDVAAYRQALDPTWQNIILGVPSLSLQRNFIVQFARKTFGPDAHVVSFDDDVTELVWCKVKQKPYRVQTLNCGFLELIAADHGGECSSGVCTYGPSMCLITLCA